MLTIRDKKYFSDRLSDSAWSTCACWAAPLMAALVAIFHVYFAIHLAAGAGHNALDLLSLWVKDRGPSEVYLGIEVRALNQLEWAAVWFGLAICALSFSLYYRRDVRVAKTLKAVQALD